MSNSFNKIFLYFSTIVLGQLVSFLLVPIITKNVNPEIYGEYALTLTIFNLVGVFGSSWIRNISFRLYFDQKNKKTTRSFFINSVVFQFFTISCLILVIVPLIQLSSFKFGSTYLLIAAGISVIVGDFSSYIVDLLRAEDLPKEFAISQAASAITRFASISLGLWFGLKTPLFLFSCTAISGIISAFFGISFLKSKLIGNINFEKNSIREIFTLGITSLPTSVGGWILALSDRIVLKQFTNLQTVGIYSVGYSLAERLVGGIASAIFMMAWPNILEEWRKRGDLGATDAIHQSLKVYFWFTIGPLFLIFGFSSEITSILTSEEYISASSILPIVALGCWVNGLKKYYSRPLELKKNYKLMSLITMIAAGINLGLNFVLIPTVGAMGAALSTLVAFSLSFLIFVVLVDRKMMKFPWSNFWASLLFSSLALLVAIQIRTFFFQILIFGIIYGAGIIIYLGNRKMFLELLALKR